MALTHRGAGAADNGGGATTVTCVSSSAPVAGDNLLLAVSYRSDLDDPTPPVISGVTWTELPGLNPANGGTATPDLRLFAWEGVASDTTNSFQVTLPESCKAVAGILVFYDDGGADVVRSADGGGDGIVVATGDGTGPSIATGSRGNGDQYLAGLFSLEGLPSFSENGDLSEDAVDASTGGSNGTRNRIAVGHLITSSDTASKTHSYTAGSSNAYEIAVVMYEADAGGGTINLNADAIAVPVNTTTDTLALSLDLSASALAIPAAEPTSALDLSLALAATPLTVPLSVPTDTIDLGALVLSASPIAAVVDLATASLITGDGDIELLADPIAMVLDAPTAALALSLGLSASPLTVPAAVPTALIVPGAITLSASPIASSASIASPALSARLTLQGSAIPVLLAVPDGSIATPLTISATPISLAFGLVELDLDGGNFETGSDLQLVLDSVAFWEAYDALATEAEKAALYRQFILEHGGRRVMRYGLVQIEGGFHPVRVDID